MTRYLGSDVTVCDRCGRVTDAAPTWLYPDCNCPTEETS